MSVFGKGDQQFSDRQLVNLVESFFRIINTCFGNAAQSKPAAKAEINLVKLIEHFGADESGHGMVAKRRDRERLEPLGASDFRSLPRSHLEAPARLAGSNWNIGSVIEAMTLFSDMRVERTKRRRVCQID